MATWRMAFREGNRGPTLWPECLRLGVAAITYEPLEKVDLSKYPEGEPRTQWARLSPTQKASLRRLAYEMQSGDVIYVKEGPKIVGKGYVTGGYRFDAESRIVDSHGIAWVHQVPVNWLTDFPGVNILLGAEQFTVKPLTAADVQRIESVPAEAAESREEYFARLCWNTRNWICPSGDASKTEDADTYAARMGFGHEEWLFNFNWLVDGWKYSFLQPVNRSLASLKGEKIDVRLFTVGGTKGWFYVGEIEGCEVLTKEQARHALDQFRVRGWLRDMEGHVRAVHGDISGLQGDDPCSVFNIRFRRKNAELYDPPVPVEDGDAIRRITRYSLIAAKDASEVGREWRTRVAATKERPTGKIHRRSVAATEVELNHNATQESLAATLQARYGKDAVVKEEGFVDIKLRDGRRLVFIEIKSDPTPRRALRTAIGQLLEYEFFSTVDGQTPTELVVAAPGALSSQLDLDYLHHLQTRWSLPIKYVCISPEEGEPEI